MDDSRIISLPTARPWLFHGGGLFFLFILCMSYSPATVAHFNYDDHVLIVNNPAIRDLRELPTLIASGRPMRGISFMIDYHLFGMNARGFHLTNMAWHYLAAALFYFLLVRLFGRGWTALGAASLFMLHPVHAEAVMAIAHRKEMLAFSFMLLAWHAWIFREKRPAAATAAAAVFFLLALLSKQVAVVLPVLFLCRRYFEGKQFLTRRLLITVAPLLLLGSGILAAGSLISAPLLRDFNFLTTIPQEDETPGGYFRVLATALSVIPKDFRFLFFPVHFNIDHHIPLASFREWKPWAGLLLFAGVSALAVFRRREPLIGFSLAWIVINLLPIMNLIPANAFFSERYLYIPSAGACLLICAALQKTDAVPLGPPMRKAIRAVALFATLLVLIASPLSLRIITFWSVWRGGVHLDRGMALIISALLAAGLGTAAVYGADKLNARWKTGLRRAASRAVSYYLIIACLYLGSAVMMEIMIHHRLGLPAKDIDKGWAKSRAWFEKHAKPGPNTGKDALIRLSGGSRAELFNLALTSFAESALIIIILRAVGSHLEGRRRRWGAGCEIYVVLAVTFSAVLAYRNAQWASETTLWSSAADENPKSFIAWNNLGKAWFDRNRFDRAAFAYRKTIELLPDSYENHRNLGMTLRLAGDLKGAKQAYAQALELNPNDPDANTDLANLIVVEALANNHPAALAGALPYYLRALEFSPPAAAPYNNLAYYHYLLRDFDRAREYVHKAMASDPMNEKSLLILRALEQAQTGGN